jgi:hypothetical protein
MVESQSCSAALNLKAGEWVEVRRREEILATLDERGRLENLPFMPEMLQYCGQKLRVFKRADKTCDNIQEWSIRRMKDSVHLDGARCDGTGHDSCQAGCLIFWKEAWLKRSDVNTVSGASLGQQRVTANGSGACRGLCTVEDILKASKVSSFEREAVYSCQATELRNFTSYMAFWDLRQYIRDLRSGNLDSADIELSRPGRVFVVILSLWQLVRALLISTYNSVQRFRHGYRYPEFIGKLDRTPTEILDLQPGELVQVRSREEIIVTLDQNSKNRGLFFGPEMAHYCGGIYRVLRRVHHIIDEKTGKMVDMKSPCIVLEGVWCQLSDYYQFCPKAIYHYWHEIWLKRAADVKVPATPEQVHETCEKC